MYWHCRRVHRLPPRMLLLRCCCRCRCCYCCCCCRCCRCCRRSRRRRADAILSRIGQGPDGRATVGGAAVPTLGRLASTESGSSRNRSYPSRVFKCAVRVPRERGLGQRRFRRAYKTSRRTCELACESEKTSRRMRVSRRVRVSCESATELCNSIALLFRDVVCALASTPQRVCGELGKLQ